MVKKEEEMVVARPEETPEETSFNSTETSSGCSVFDALENMISKRRVEEGCIATSVPFEGEMDITSVNDDEVSTYQFIENNRQFIKENEASLCSEHLADFARHQILYPPTAPSSSSSSSSSPSSSTGDDGSLKSHQMGNNAAHERSVIWDDHDLLSIDHLINDLSEASASSKEQKRRENVKDYSVQNSRGEFDSESDVKGSADDAYTGRSVKNAEFLIQDIEVNIGKMRSKHDGADDASD